MNHSSTSLRDHHMFLEQVHQELIVLQCVKFEKPVIT